MPTYDELFQHILKQLSKKTCDHTLRYTKAFAEKHGLDFADLKDRLSYAGGYCDCEVLLNAEDNIFGDEVIGHETVISVKEYIDQHGYYCHNLVDGKPVSRSDAGAAAKAGQKVEWYVPCKATDPFALPDFYRALVEMHQRNLLPSSDAPPRATNGKRRSKVTSKRGAKARSRSQRK
jgi:hypothetical protein